MADINKKPETAAISPATDEQKVAAVTPTQQTATPVQESPTPPAGNTQPTTSAPSFQMKSFSAQTTVPRMSYVDTTEMEKNLKQINDEAAKQAKLNIDEATRTTADQLRQQEREAAAQYAEQQKQISAEERQALDNSALYAEARGDRGGVGQAQYNAVQASAAKNRASVQAAQTKMSSDVNRQIGDLRRQGEYQKAEALLTLSQQYLSQLNQLKQWAAEMNMSVDQVNLSIAQWEKEFAMAEADITGTYNGSPTMAAQQFNWQKAKYEDETAYNREQDALQNARYDEEVAREAASALENRGWTKLDAGIVPSAEELRALGITAEQATGYINAVKEAAAATENRQNQSALANNGWTALDAGMMPSAAQLSAMGITESAAQGYIEAMNKAKSDDAAAATKSELAAQGWKSLNAGLIPSDAQLNAMDVKRSDVEALLKGLTESAKEDYDGLFEAASKAASPENYIASHYKEYGFSSKEGLLDAFEDYEFAEDEGYVEEDAATSEDALRDLSTDGLPTTTDDAQTVSLGVREPFSGEYISRLDPRIQSVTTDKNGNTVYHMRDGRTLFDYSTNPTYATEISDQRIRDGLNKMLGGR